MAARDGQARAAAWGDRARAARILVLVAVLVAGAAACSDDDRSPEAKASATTTVGAGTAAGGPAGALEDAFVAVLQRVRPSVVEISTGSGLGSGVVYDDKGNIVTNAHVVGDATRFSITLVDGRSLDGTLVGAYPPDDLAVIKVSGDGLVPAAFADSGRVAVGQLALAIGNPLGLESSVTDGIVSSTGRTVSAGGGVVLPSTIQTSAAINPGNSGGALVDLDGDVIGIPTLAAADPGLGGGTAPGIGFAIPSNTVKRIADQLIATGRVTDSGRAALGISGANATTLTGEPVGVLVRSVQPGQAADAAGVRPGDIITAVAGKPTPTLQDLQTVLAGLAPGQETTVDVSSRDGGKRSYRVALGRL